MRASTVWIVAAVFLLPSCAPAGGLAVGLALVLSLGLVLSACGETGTSRLRSDAGRQQVEEVVPPSEQEGHWERCCQDGRVESCWCPGPSSCNFGWTCIDEDFPDAGAVEDDGVAEDSGIADVEEGTWEPCCRSGTITTCYCPAGHACNFGWFTDCGEGRCVVPPDRCG